MSYLAGETWTVDDINAIRNRLAKSRDPNAIEGGKVIAALVSTLEQFGQRTYQERLFIVERLKAIGAALQPGGPKEAGGSSDPSQRPDRNVAAPLI